MGGDNDSDSVEMTERVSNTTEHTGLLIPSGDNAEDGTTKLRGVKKSSLLSAKKKRISTSNNSNAADEDHASNKFIKYFALFLLVAQMVGLVLLMRYSRTQQDPNVPLYLASTAVFVMEVMKLIICLLVIAYQSGGAFFSELHQHVVRSPLELLKLTVPSFLYCVQNNLLYLALTNLDAATYQVCYQLKILTTALFSAILLQRKFSPQKWLSLVILTVGVAIVQISGSGDVHTNKENSAQNRMIGLGAVLCAACTSGFSGVYFEKILKGSRTSLWIRNVQMGLPSTIIAYLTIYGKDAVAVREHGFFGGYTNLVWTVVTVQAVGGLIVAVVVRYADNVLKVFATSFSIIVSCVISAFLFDFHPSLSFLVGTSLVVVATVMYSAPESKRKRKMLLPTVNKSRK
jgi:UDP-sugar transporter A1/2/3